MSQLEDATTSHRKMTPLSPSVRAQQSQSEATANTVNTEKERRLVDVGANGGVPSLGDAWQFRGEVLKLRILKRTAGGSFRRPHARTVLSPRR